MPKYELMYILSSAVSDNDVPNLSAEVDKFITANAGNLFATQLQGKKKLAYPIKKTRNGFYVLTTFDLQANKTKELDAKIRSIESIIRYLIINLDDLELRKAKDAKVHEKMRLNRKPQATEAASKPDEIKITEDELEQKIEAALGSEDLAK